MGKNSEILKVQEDVVDIVIRPGEEEDRAGARAIQWAAGWKDAPSRHRTWQEPDEVWHSNSYFREYIAEVKGVIAARVGMEAYQPPFAEIIDLCVRPDFRRLGLGEALTRHCEQEAARRGFLGLFLQTELDNTAAHRLYSNLGFFPTAFGKMLRMVKLFDYSLLNDFTRTHPLNQYSCLPVPNVLNGWSMEWHAYVTNDYLHLQLEGGASKTESDRIAPALTRCDWRAHEGQRFLKIQLDTEDVQDLEQGNHVEVMITLTNLGKVREKGVFQMVLPLGIRVSSPASNIDRTFLWQAEPGETVCQSCLLYISTLVDTSVLHELNYSSIPVSMEAYWDGGRVLLSRSLPFAAPLPESELES